MKDQEQQELAHALKEDVIDGVIAFTTGKGDQCPYLVGELWIPNPTAENVLEVLHVNFVKIGDKLYRVAVEEIEESQIMYQLTDEEGTEDDELIYDIPIHHQDLLCLV